jgi:hypothetical protein
MKQTKQLPEHVCCWTSESLCLFWCPVCSVSHPVSALIKCTGCPIVVRASKPSQAIDPVPLTCGTVCTGPLALTCAVCAGPLALPCLQPALQSDWLSFTSRPWVQGPVDAFLGNTQLAAMMSQHKELAATVEGLVRTVDAALIKVSASFNAVCFTLSRGCTQCLAWRLVMESTICKSAGRFLAAG